MSNRQLRAGRVAGSLRWSLEAWDGLIESLPIAVYVCDRDGLIVQYNQRAVELWGRAPALGDSDERFCGSHMMFLVDGRRLAHADCPMAEVLRTGQPVRNGRIVIARPDGTFATALVNIDPLFDEDGRQVGAVNCFQDITELERANAEALARKEEFEDFFENAAVPLHIVGPDGTILQANRAELEALGYERDEYVGRNIAEFHADPVAIDTILRTLHQGEKLQRFPARLRAKDGSLRDVLITSNAQFRDGKFVHTRCFTIDVTDHLRAQEALREYDQQLAITYDKATVSIIEVDREGRRLRVNEAACRLMEQTREEMIGGSIFDNVHPDDLDADRIQFQRLVRGEIDQYSLEKRYTRDPERPKWVEVTCSAVRDADGRFRYAVRVFDDITESKLMAEALAESEQRLAATYEQAMVGISEADAEGRLLRVNEASCRITGYTREELLARGPFFQRMRTEDLAFERELYRRQVAGELDRYTIEKRIRRKDESEIWVAVMSSSVRDSNGKFRYSVRVLQDITQRKLAEERLWASEQHLRELLEALPVAVYTTDAEGRITFFNQAAVEFSGRVPVLHSDEWCVTWRLYRPDGTPLAHDECPMAVALKEGRAVRGVEAVAERPDGTRVPFIPYPTPLYDADGKMIGAVNMLFDISERKRSEGRLKTMIDELNHRVKNTLATVQSLLRQSARASANAEELEARLLGRLFALSRAHDQLASRSWQDADLADILRPVLSPYDDGDRIVVSGEPVRLSSRAALTLAMVFHELITNAAKYGALSQPGGRLYVNWTVAPETPQASLKLEWRERGGPPVAAPNRRGFGTTMVERSIPNDLGGKAELHFDPDGVRCTLEFPMANGRDDENKEPRRAARSRRRG